MSDPVPPLRVLQPGGTNQIPVFELEVSGATVVTVSPIRARLLIDSGAGGTGAPTDAPYITYSANATLSAERILTASSGIQTTTSSTQFFIQTSAKTLRFPMALATVQPDSANAFWTIKSGTTVDQGYVAFVDSGVGTATYWTQVPLNVAPSPVWSLWLYQTPNAGSGGFCIFSLSGRMVAAIGSIDAAYTSLVSVGTIATQTSNILGIDTTTATNFDSTLALTSGGMLFVELIRHGNLAGDTLGTQWNVYSVALQCDVR